LDQGNRIKFYSKSICLSRKAAVFFAIWCGCPVIGQIRHVSEQFVVRDVRRKNASISPGERIASAENKVTASGKASAKASDTSDSRTPG
jgi:hypothetical protein